MSAADSHPLDLRDASQAGVYRVMCADVAPLLALAADEDVSVREIDLTGANEKRELIGRIHAALDFPDDWGRNWDALADGLNDLTWLGELAPRLLVWRGMDTLHADAPEPEYRSCRRTSALPSFTLVSSGMVTSVPLRAVASRLRIWAFVSLGDFALTSSTVSTSTFVKESCDTV